MKNSIIICTFILTMFILNACELNVDEMMEIVDTLGIENIQIDTQEGVDFKCIPPGYSIVYNGEFFIWRILDERYTYPELFDTKVEAMESANIYYENRIDYFTIFPTLWIQVKSCVSVSFMPQKLKGE